MYGRSEGDCGNGLVYVEFTLACQAAPGYVRIGDCHCMVDSELSDFGSGVCI